MTTPYPYAVTEEPRSLSDEDLAFLSRYTGVKDLDKLRKHVLEVWRSVKAQSWVYCCIQRMQFLQPRITGHEYYGRMLEAIKSDEPIHVLDLGCCFGQDTRELLMNGLPQDRITVVDITPDYWEAGKKLFMDAKKMEEPTGGWGEGATAGVEAIFGSFTDPAFVSTDPPVGPLGRLAGRVTHAWAGAVLHVLSKQDVEAFAAHALAMLAPGGVWIGTCVGAEQPSEWAHTPADREVPRFLHSADSLAALMREVGFKNVDVKAVPREDASPEGDFGPTKVYLMFTGFK